MFAWVLATPLEVITVRKITEQEMKLFFEEPFCEFKKTVWFVRIYCREIL